jgi:hypothetical protein
MKHLTYISLLALFFCSCQKDPASGIKSHERAIESFSAGAGLVQIGPAVINRDSSTVTVRVLVQPANDFSKVKPAVVASYKSTIEPASGAEVNFAKTNNQATYTVTSETGEKRQWKVILQPFSEALLGTFKINGLVAYGGTGPEYGGGAVLKLDDKPWVWPAADGPSAELDNTLTFTYTGVTPDGNTYGKVVNSAGADGKYASFVFIQNPQTDVNSFYRKIPKGEGTWLHNYASNTVTFTFADNSTSTGTFEGAGTTNLGNGLNKTVTDNAFKFTLNGVDDWNNIYSDYDKFVKHPRIFWIDVKKN